MLKKFIKTQAQVLNMIHTLIRNFQRINKLRPNDALVLQVESPDLKTSINIQTKVRILFQLDCLIELDKFFKD